MISSNRHFKLVIESAIAGGSIALFEDNSRIDGVLGPSGVSRAEDLLNCIDVMLTRNRLNVDSIGTIVVGAGPGSFTGIRIGIATAMGLADALQVELRQVSTLEAIAWAARRTGKVFAALPVGRDTICCQQFSFDLDGGHAIDEPTPYAENEFIGAIDDIADSAIVVNDTLFDNLSGEHRGRIINIGDDLASAIGQFSDRLTELNEPLFVGKRTF